MGMPEDKEQNATAVVPTLQYQRWPDMASLCDCVFAVCNRACVSFASDESPHQVSLCENLGESCTNLNPFRTAVPFWGQTTYNLSGLSPKTGLRS